ncbi:YaiI/YqxD family protein [Enterococcus asini]|uniref:YaiI/YqxD family protein n=1 Tax=Enterococcus asini TaxID=57732 RepID=UPI00288FF362|nr:YaiI/YqxD family protein [Enterococcus asini]MDT2757390.1 YaiI/YqxD family protein [Enterococcus asini]
MRFVIDGDGSPVKNEVIALGAKFQVPVVIVTSVDHYTLKEYPAFVQFIYVDKGADRADYCIIQEILPGDWVITQDYGLASLVLGKEARVFHHSGREYTSANIDELLTQRFLGAQMRKAKKRTKGPKPFTASDREQFTQVMEERLKSLT